MREHAEYIRDHQGEPLTLKGATVLDLSRFLSKRILALRSMNQAYNMLLSDPSASGEISIKCSKFWLERVIDIVVENSAQALQKAGTLDGRIVIYAATGDRTARISVSDNGGGIPAAVLDAFRAGRVAAEPGHRKRRGLGLLMAQVILQEYGGDVLPGNSATFGGAEVVLTVPLA